MLREKGEHRLHDRRIDFGRRVGVEIDRLASTNSSMGGPADRYTRIGTPISRRGRSRIPETVTLASWQPTQAPVSLTNTFAPSTSISSQSPPSLRR